MNLAELKKVNLKEKKKFIEVITKDLINLEFKNTEVYKLYDYIEFNSVMFITSDNLVIFFLTKILLLGLMCCILTNNYETTNLIAYISGREKSGIQKSKDFILEFNNQLNNIKFEYTKKHINIIGKTTFFDEENMNYRLFDFEEFNALLSLEYERFYLNPVLEKNYLYNLMNNHLNIFLQDALEKKIFISFFFEVLRKARLRQNIFDLIKIESEFPEKIYLNCREVYIDNTKKILKNYINLLAEYKILRKNQNILLEFFCSSELENLINLSFDTPKLGNQNGFGVADTKFSFEFALDHQKELIFKENDFMFHYILAGHTNCITLYSKKINNIYQDRLIKRHNFYQYI